MSAGWSRRDFLKRTAVASAAAALAGVRVRAADSARVV